MKSIIVSTGAAVFICVSTAGAADKIAAPKTGVVRSGTSDQSEHAKQPARHLKQAGAVITSGNAATRDKGGNSASKPLWGFGRSQATSRDGAAPTIDYKGRNYKGR